MRLLLLAITVSCLGGCAWLSPTLSKNAISYNTAIQDSSDKLLVVNILRARDNAPLHFGDVPSIHETIQANASLATSLLFGPVHGGTGSDTTAPTVSFQDSPTIEMDNLDTQDFYTGIMSPIQPKVVKYWLDRGLDDRIVLLLFFANVKITTATGSEVVQNAPHAAEPEAFAKYLTVVNHLKQGFTAVASPDRTPIGPPFALNMKTQLKDIVRIDPAKYELLEVDKKQHLFQLFTDAPDPKITFCVNKTAAHILDKLGKPSGNSNACSSDGDGDGVATSAPEEKPTCPFEPDAWLQNPTRCDLKTIRFDFAVRSVGDVVHFLGDLQWREENPSLKPHLNDPITVGYCLEKAACDNDEGGTLFKLVKGSEEGRFSVPYLGDTYAVPADSPADHTLQVLAIVNQLLNLNKAAKDLRSTPLVQVIP